MELTLTLITFLIFLVLFLGIGAYAAAKATASEDDYLIGGRSFGSLFVGLSAGATGNSGFWP